MMAVNQPILDRRDQQQLVEELYQLLLAYCPEWQSREAIRLDPQAEAVARIFARMGETVVQHLNRVPEKNFLTFLDLVGTDLKSPQVAKAPLGFALATGAGNYGFVPAGTQVAAAATNGGPDAVFETAADLTVILPQVTRAISITPNEDRWTEHRLNQGKAVPAQVFAGKDLIPRRLYLGHAKLFDIKGNTIISLKINLKEEIGAVAGEQWQVNWYCFTDGKPTLLKPYSIANGKENPRVPNLLESGTLYFNNINLLSESALNGVEQQSGVEQNVARTSRWIYAELETPITAMPAGRLPEIRTVQAAVNFISGPTGRGTITSKSTELTGKNTAFLDELRPGDQLIARNQSRIVKTIISDQLLILNDGFEPELTEDTEYSFVRVGMGTLYCRAGSRQIMGTETIFTAQLEVGNCILVESKFRRIEEIVGDNQLTVTEPFEEGLVAGTVFSYMVTPVVKLDKGFCNDLQLDVTRDFSPFGQRAEFNDTFYLGSDEVFSKPGAIVALTVELTKGRGVYHEQVVLSWEYWDGRAWQPLGETGSQTAEKNPKIEDTTKAFTQNGTITFVCPKIESSKLHGEANRWIRIRLVSGNYGEDVKYFEQAVAGDERYLIVIKDGRKYKRIPTENGFVEELLGYREKTEWIMNPATLKPPSIRSMTLSYRFKAEYQDLDFIYTENNFAFQNQIAQMRAAGTGWFRPFGAPLSGDPALYLGFDRDAGELPVSLYLALTDKTALLTERLSFAGMGPKPEAAMVQLKNVLNLEPGDWVELSNPQGESEQRRIVMVESTTGQIGLDAPLTKDFSLAGSEIYRLEEPPQSVWEYWNGKAWTALTAADHTQNMTRREIVQFMVPDNFKPCALFSAMQFWIRARLATGSERRMPELTGIYNNAVWAHHRTTLRDEVLGSSNGMPNQVFQLRNVPVLPGQAIVVRESGLTAEERQRIREAEGADAITEILDANGDVSETWVRWQAVERWTFSAPDDRHYRIDRVMGTVTFGDAIHGKIPPAGAGNIISGRYRSGGGAAGNVKAETISKLRTTFPYIKSVTNLEAADGGADLESLERARKRGPQQLKHRQRAITASDFEWLIRDASTRVNKVKCLPTTDTRMGFEPGWVTAIVVPDSDVAAPYPSQELLSSIEADLLTKAPLELLTPSTRIHLVGPKYIRVGVSAQVQFTSLGASKEIESRIVNRLNQFFHPLTGGPEGAGWEFGRPVYSSEVYQVIEETAGVDFVTHLQLSASVQTFTLKLQNGFKPDQTLLQGTGIQVKGSPLKFGLAENLPQRATLSQITVTGFKEGDTVAVKTAAGEEAVLMIEEIAGDVLGCVIVKLKEPLMLSHRDVIGTLGTDVPVSSFLLSDTVAEAVGKTCRFKVALIEARDELVWVGAGEQAGEIAIGPVRAVQSDVVLLGENELVCAGAQAINTVTEPEFLCLADLESKLYHDLSRSGPECQLDRIPKTSRCYVKTAGPDWVAGEQLQPCSICNQNNSSR